MVIFFRQVTVTRTKVGNVESASGGMSQVGQSKDPNLAQFLEQHDPDRQRGSRPLDILVECSGRGEISHRAEKIHDCARRAR
jgi:hypothetical protein